MRDRAKEPRPDGLLEGLAFLAGKVGLRVANVSFAILCLAAVWCYCDVAPRGKVEPGRVETHRTDFSVFTTAAAAFFDGREPYTVTNPRGWSYLYPPIFALMVAPLASVDTVTQVTVWFAVSMLGGFGVMIESSRLWKRIGPSPGVDPGFGHWIFWGTLLTILVPTLECLQRGQVGIVLLYALLLGLRLILEGRTVSAWILGGIVLAWAVAVKLIPALPVAFLIWQQGVLTLRTSASMKDRFSIERTASIGLGVTLGLILFLLVIPSTCLGWDANLRHLETWKRKVVTNPDAGDEAKFHIDSTSNQSFTNAAHRLATSIRGQRPDDPAPTLLKAARNEGEIRWAIDRAFAEKRKADVITHRIVLVIEGLIALLLLGIATSTRRQDPIGEVAGFGLACVAMLLLSPVAWSHYFMMMIPAVIAVPVWLSERGHPFLARLSLVIPAALVLTHYLAKTWVGPLGLLGLGTTLWFLVLAAALLVSNLTLESTSRFYRPRFARGARAYESSETTSN